ncbi:MAG TPA: extracellular solute-binding protein [Kofleriaceae bacterium]|nr:extracellular solute-binding protein [Kofleriaceae bacterium]
MKWLLALCLIACGSSREGVVLWHAYNGPERAALEHVAAEWNDLHPETPLTLVQVPYDAFADKITSAVPNGNGPDLFVYSHDRIGDWAAAGVIEPIEFWVDDSIAGRYQKDALAAMAYRDDLWGLPMALKCLALFYRTDRISAPPKTTDELFAMAARARGSYPLAYANSDLYDHAPWLHGFGGVVLDEHGELRIASAEAADAMAFSKRLIDRGVVPAETTGPLVETLFNEGKADMALEGPWFVGDIAKGVPWAVSTLPIVSETGRPAAPFFSAEGVLMSARARDKDAAFAVMLFIAGDRSANERARDAGQIVPNAGVHDDATQAVFRKQLEHTVLIPAAPAMRMVWTPYMTALAKVQSGGESPSDALLEVEREVRRYSEPPR